MSTKTCFMCERTKPLGEFYADTRKPDGRRHNCKDCHKKRAVDNQRKRWYGLTPEDFQALLDAQHNRCAACQDELGTGFYRAIDHCHETGRVRGVLCRHCNLALGHAKDDPVRLSALLEYLVA